MGMFRAIYVLICLPAILFGCATGSSNKPKLGEELPENGYSLLVADDPPNKRFTLKLTSLVERQSCVYFEDWPNKNGYLHFASDRVFVSADGKRFPIKDRNMGYCTGGCYVTIPPLGAIESAIPYSEFEGDIPLSDDIERSLTYSVQPYFCD